MRRSTILLAAALVALPALAAAQTTKNDTGKPAATSREKGKKAASPAKSAASKPSPASPASKPSAASKASGGAAANPGLNPAARAEMLRRRSTFRYAAESCADGRDRCNHELLDEAEKTFVNACRACDTVDRCDAERTAIREGGTNVTTKLCVPVP